MHGQMDIFHVIPSKQKIIFISDDWLNYSWYIFWLLSNYDGSMCSKFDHNLNLLRWEPMHTFEIVVVILLVGLTFSFDIKLYIS